MDQSVKDAYSDRLRKAMRHRGYVSTRASSGVDMIALANAAGVSREMARKYVDGKSIPRADVQELICNWLKISQQWLQYGDGQMERISAGEIDRAKMRDCFIAVTRAEKELGCKLTPGQEMDLAIHLYYNEDDNNIKKIESIIKMLAS